MSIVGAALKAFSKLATHDYLYHIIPLLKDTQGNDRFEDINVLEKLISYTDLPYILTLLRKAPWEIRSVVWNVFKEIGTHDDLYLILPLFKDSDWVVRLEAVEVFGEIATNTDIKEITPLLNDKMNKIRFAGIKIFLSLCTFQDFLNNIEILNEQNFDIHTEIITKLKKFLSETSKEQLIELLLYKSIDVRHHAKQALRKISQNTSELKKYTTPKYPFDVRYYFKTALDNPSWLDVIESQIWNI